MKNWGLARECEVAGKKLASYGNHDPFKIRHMCMH